MCTNVSFLGISHVTNFGDGRIPQTQTTKTLYSLKKDARLNDIDEGTPLKDESQNTLRTRARSKRKRMESIRSVEGETVTIPELELGK